MCGVAGVFCADVSAAPDERPIRLMLESIRHRGPDAQRTWVTAGVALGHVRLSILDLDSRSDQPMIDPDTGNVLVYNGEIYNYLELRKQLESLGYRFRTDGDTEVLLKAYERWGVDCLNRLDGMWAFALYNAREKTLFCSRDRFGIKPFIYGWSDGRLVFASEAKAFRTLEGRWTEPNLPFLQGFLRNSDFAGYEETFYSRLYNLLPGHYFIVRHGEAPRPLRYWNWSPRVEHSTRRDADVLEHFASLLEDSIRLRFRSDVPVGMCLSGGLDSSLLVALSTRLFGQPVSTFSCVFPECPHLDESTYIREMVSRFGCQAHFTTPRVDDLLQAMRQSVWEQDGPTGGPSVLSQRSVMALAKGQVKVLLDGQGGDEVLGGYHSYFLPTLNGLMRQLLQKPSFHHLGLFLSTRRAIQRRVGKGYVPSFSKSWKIAHRPVRYQRPRHGRSVLEGLPAEHLDDLNARMLEDLLLTLCNLLHYEDRNSMVHSLESRLPFLDFRLVEFLFSLPSTFKIRGAQTKFLLSETVKDLLPASIFDRKDKMGFSTPGQQWYRQDSETAKALDRLLMEIPEPLQLEKNWIAGLQPVWRQCRNGRPIRTQDENALWRYLTACLWLESLEAPFSLESYPKNDRTVPV